MSLNNRRVLAAASVLVLTTVVLFVYASSLTTGFFADDYNFLEPVARLNLADYIIHYFDPRIQVMWYRPLQGIQILLEWKLFGANATGYHLVNILFHAVNCALLFALVWRLSNKWRLAFASALLYATFPVYALAINWINITDPLATIFFLLGIWFWLDYVQRGRRLGLSVTLAAYVLGLLSKQMVITLPLVLFLMERLLLNPRPVRGNNLMQRFLDWLNIPEAIRRYAPFAVVLIVFAGIQYGTRSTHTFAGVFGYSVGLQMVSILLQYASLAVFPWGYFIPNDTQITEGMPFADERNLAWLAAAIVLYLYVTWRTRNRVLLFLGITWLIVIMPVLPFPFVELRYLYLPGMTSGIALGLLFEHALQLLGRRRLIGVFAGIAAALIVVGSSWSIANANAGIYELARQRRVPFRDIARQHPTFPADTYLYFIDPITPLSELKGMFTLQYGPGVIVGSDTAPDPRPRLSEHKDAVVYYFDETGKPHEVAVQPNLTALPSLPFPVQYRAPLQLDGVDLVRSQVKRGDMLIALLNWRALEKVGSDYTVFVHLADKNGKVIAGHDSQPHKGSRPTSRWIPGTPIVDPIVLPIPSDAPLGEHYLEVGLYAYPSLARLEVKDASDQITTDVLLIGPIRVESK